MMSGFWSDEAQERAYGMLLDGEIRLSNNVDKFQLLRSVASWSEDDCFDFVDAYPRQQQELLRAELPGPASTHQACTHSVFMKKINLSAASDMFLTLVQDLQQNLKIRGRSSRKPNSGTHWQAQAGTPTSSAAHPSL